MHETKKVFPSLSLSLSFQSSETSFFFLSAHSLSLIHVLLSLSPFFNSHSRKGEKSAEKELFSFRPKSSFFSRGKKLIWPKFISLPLPLSLEKKYS